MHQYMSIQEKSVKMWKQDLRSISRTEEKIRIVSGEAFCDLYRQVKELFILAKNKYDAIFKMIAGPIFSTEDGNGTNAVLELAEEGYLDLWISPYRQPTHHRIFDMKFMYKEDYHTSLSRVRTGKYLDDPLVLSKYTYDFDNLISSLQMKKYSNRNSVILRNKKQIEELQEKYGRNYDFLLNIEKATA